MEEILYLLQKHPDWLWTTAVLYAFGTGHYVRGVKAVLKLATNLQSSAEFKKEWSYTSAPFCVPSWHVQGQLCPFLADTFRGVRSRMMKLTGLLWSWERNKYVQNFGWKT